MYLPDGRDIITPQKSKRGVLFEYISFECLVACLCRFLAPKRITRLECNFLNLKAKYLPIKSLSFLRNVSLKSVEQLTRKIAEIDESPIL